jgi:hypothetical protein
MKEREYTEGPEVTEKFEEAMKVSFGLPSPKVRRSGPTQLLRANQGIWNADGNRCDCRSIVIGFYFQHDKRC